MVPHTPLGRLVGRSHKSERLDPSQRAMDPPVSDVKNYKKWTRNRNLKGLTLKQRKAQVMNVCSDNLKQIKSNCILLEVQMSHHAENLRIRSEKKYCIGQFYSENSFSAHGCFFQDRFVETTRIPWILCHKSLELKLLKLVHNMQTYHVFTIR